MTRYGSNTDPYVPESSFEEWLNKKGYPESYSDIFSWDENNIQVEYERLFEEYEKMSEQLGALEGIFEDTHKARIAYMQEHGIQQWSDLDPIDDKVHIENKDAFFEKVVRL